MGGEQLVSRRLMLRNANDACPYITDGLIFWLDGINRGNDPTKWVDRISGKVFDLVNCVNTANGVQLNAGNNSLAFYQGAISNNCYNETIEVCSEANNGYDGYVSVSLFCQPKIGNSVGASLISGNTVAFNINVDGARYKNFRTKNETDLENRIKRISLNADNMVLGGVALNNNGTDSWGANTTGNTYLGGRNGGSTYNFTGIIHSVRIYNRKLSVSEMQQNQTVDLSRFLGA